MDYKCKCGKEIKEYNGFKVFDNNNGGRPILLCEECFMKGVEEGIIFYCDYHNRTEMHDKKEMHRRGRRANVCSEIYNAYKDDGYPFCSECGILMTTRDEVCPDCREQTPVESNRIENYHTSKNRPPYFYGESLDGIYFGLEIESEFENDYEDIVGSYPQRVREVCCFEYDGSLSCGFETITSPLSYEFIVNNNILEEITDSLSQDMCVSSRCGLHIHITKTDKVLEKLPYMISFFENNKHDIETLSQREAGRYCQHYTPVDSDITLDDAKSIISIGNFVNRYRSINITNENTVEFRCFAGTLNPKRMIGYIQFILSLLELDIDENSDFRYLADNVSEEYTELIAILDNMGYSSDEITVGF